MVFLLLFLVLSYGKDFTQDIKARFSGNKWLRQLGCRQRAGGSGHCGIWRLPRQKHDPQTL